MTTTRTPAQIYALVFGADGSRGRHSRDAGFGGFGGGAPGEELILFEVNGWHNLVHIASGVLGLALMASAAGARAYALGFGVATSR